MHGLIYEYDIERLGFKKETNKCWVYWEYLASKLKRIKETVILN